MRCESREGRLNEPIKGGDTGAETAHMKQTTDTPVKKTKLGD